VARFWNCNLSPISAFLSNHFSLGDDFRQPEIFD
jgi:hypothetical protein